MTKNIRTKNTFIPKKNYFFKASTTFESKLVTKTTQAWNQWKVFK